jgi:perosamine synthetase
MLRFVAPAGAPMEASKILRAVSAAILHRSKEENLRSLVAVLEATHIFGVSSGRSALALILRSLQRLRPGRDIVALPSYTCFTVPAAVVRAGFRVHLIEIDPTTLDFEFNGFKELPRDRVLAIVSSNLFGLANNAACIETVARAHGAFFVDDAAQAMGASRNGKLAGLAGDVGFYSFGRGKALAAIDGGLIVTNSDEIASAVQKEAIRLPAGTFIHAAWTLSQMLAYCFLLRPRLYWIPQSIPFLNLGTTEFNPGFPESKMLSVVQELIIRTHELLGEFNKIRRLNAAAICEGLKGNPLFTFVCQPEDSQPTYIRFPLIARDEVTRDRAVKKLQSAGIGATPFYPSAVCDIEGIGPHMAEEKFHCPVAENLSRRLLTLPTHPYVQPRDVEAMIKTLARL